jgi:hypothetical protein
MILRELADRFGNGQEVASLTQTQSVVLTEQFKVFNMLCVCHLISSQEIVCLLYRFFKSLANQDNVRL